MSPLYIFSNIVHFAALAPIVTLLFFASEEAEHSSNKKTKLLDEGLKSIVRRFIGNSSKKSVVSAS